MKVYRISKSEYAYDLSGTGARLFGGRWNHVDIPCIYTSASRALAILEFSVNANVEFIPPNLSIAVFELSDELIFRSEDLPEDWRNVPAPLSAKDWGSGFLKKNVPILEVPSVVVPSEKNYILNPVANEGAFALLDVQEYTYDLRIKK